MNPSPSNETNLPYLDMRLESRTEEIWDDIPGLDGAYQMSNFGRVLRVARHYYDSLGRPGYCPEKIIAAHVNKDRNMHKKDWTHRLQVSCQIERKKQNFQVARIVYYLFVQAFDLDDSNLVISYKNYNGLDVRPDNLELLNYHEKNVKAYKTNRQVSPFRTDPIKHYESIQKRVRCVSCYNEEGDRITTYKSIRAASGQTGNSISALTFAASHPTARSAGYYWRKGDANKLNMKELHQAKTAHRNLFRAKVGKPVTQLDIQGNAIACYVAKSVAAKMTSISHKMISNSIKSPYKTAGGFFWRNGNLLNENFEKRSYYTTAHPINGRKLTIADCMGKSTVKPVVVTKYSLDGEPLESFPSIAAAAASVGTKPAPIWLALREHQRTAKGFYWRKGSLTENAFEKKIEEKSPLQFRYSKRV